MGPIAVSQGPIPLPSPILGTDGLPFIGPMAAPQQTVHTVLAPSPRPQMTGGMNTLAQRCQRQFPGGARARGRDYFLSGRVSDPTRNGDAYTLSVKGSGVNYNVQLDFSSVPAAKNIQGKCDCPYYEGGGLCKHLWAAILQIDKAGLSASIPDSGPIRVTHIAGGTGRPENPRADRHQQLRDRRGNRQQIPVNPTRIVPHPVGAPKPLTFGGAPWAQRLDLIQGVSTRHPGTTFSGTLGAFFVVNGAETFALGKLVLDLWTRDRLPNGEFGPLKPNRLLGNDLSRFAESRDQEMLSVLGRTSETQTFSPFGRFTGGSSSRFIVDPILETNLIPTLTGAGKLFLSRAPNGSPDDADRPLRMDRGKAWDLELKLESVGPEHYRLNGNFRRDTESRSIADPLCVFRSGFLLFSDRIGKIADHRHVGWALSLRTPEDFLIPHDQGDAFLKRILTDAGAPRLTWPDDLGWSSLTIDPKPKGVFRPLGNDPATGRMTMTVSFDYAGREVSLDDTQTMLVDVERKHVYTRNLSFEEKSLVQALGILRDNQGTGTFPVGELNRVATELSEAGWIVFIENQQLRVAHDFAMNVSTETDWFDLKMEADFGGSSVGQRELLAALEAKSGLVKLADGSLGMLPPNWMERYASFGEFGTHTAEGGLRFNKSQGLMLNAALAGDDHIRADSGFLTFQDRVRKFDGVGPGKAPKGFNGKLRNYQKEGLAWLDFIEEFQMGGILADDMGLGKTIQILAFLQGRKEKSGLPSLVVAPKSLVFNWMDEAAKFTPDLKVVAYSGAGRTKVSKTLAKADIIVTTYGTLRTDIEKIREMEFDVAIIDEAQAIKNRESQSAGAVKQIRATHRLALTGTPIENSLSDLFSILEFTSPGLLSLRQEKDLTRDTQNMLGKMLKPFLLRRTKEKVLTELPEKSEQVLFCEMSTEERAMYNGLRDHYRASLAGQIEKSGLGKSKIHVLEALLRLRQAACHPGLVDPEKKSMPSAKLSLLLSHIQEVTQEGHKALVFSQFTSLLDIVRTDMDREGIVYEYLDGQTMDRKSPVERFQTDPKCQVFLISLKAGGVGLNLTAADYVFILDPWWNPAVEAQAIGRAHRLGQSQKVFAYRMIARGTVEEKILELQKTKQELAESIISEDKDFLRKLTRDDLEMLLE